MNPVCDKIGRIEGNGSVDSAGKMCGRKNEASVAMAGQRGSSNKSETDGSRGAILEDEEEKERDITVERFGIGRINGKEDTNGAAPHEEGRTRTRADIDVEHREFRASPPETFSKPSRCSIRDIKGIMTIDDRKANGGDANAQTKRVPIDLSTLSSVARDKLASPASSPLIEATSAVENNCHVQCGVDAAIGRVLPNGGGGCSNREEDKKERKPGMKEVVASVMALGSKTVPDGSVHTISENKDGSKNCNSREIAEQMVLENHRDIRTSSDVENGEQVKDIVTWKRAQGERQNEGQEGEKNEWEEKRGDDEDQSQEKLKRENLYFENETFKCHDPTVPDVPDLMVTTEKDMMDDKRNEQKSSLERHVYDADVIPATEEESAAFTRRHSDLQDSSAGKWLSSNEVERQESDSEQRQWTPEECDNQMNAQKVEPVQVLVGERDVLEEDPDMVTKRNAVEKMSKLEEQNCEKHMAQMESAAINKTNFKLSMFQRTFDGQDYNSTGKKESSRRHHLLRHVLPEDTCLEVILKHFDVETSEEAALKIQSLSQRELQSAFEIVYGKKALSNNNQWLRKKLTDALPLTEKAICTANNDGVGQDNAERDSAFQSPDDAGEISRKRRKYLDSSLKGRRSNCTGDNGSTQDYLSSLDGRDSRKSRRKASEGVQAATAALLRDPELEALEREDAKWQSSRLKSKQRKQSVAPESVKFFSDRKQDLSHHQQDIKKLDESNNSQREGYLQYLLDEGKSSEMLSSYVCNPSVRQPNTGINGHLSYLMNGKEMQGFKKFVSTGDFSNEEKYTSSVHNVPTAINEEAPDSVCEKKMPLNNSPIYNPGTNYFGIDASVTGKIPPFAEKDKVGSDRYMEVPESCNNTTFDNSHQANLLKENLEAMFLHHASAKMKDFCENSMAHSASGYYNLSNPRDYSGAVSSEKLQSMNMVNQSNFNISPEIAILQKLLAQLQQSNIDNVQGALRLMSILVSSISEKWNMYLHAGNELEKKMEQHQKECHLQSLMLESLHKQIQEEVENRLHEHNAKEAPSHAFDSCSDMHSRDTHALYYVPEMPGNSCHGKNSTDLEYFDLKSKLYAQIAELTNIGESLKKETVNAPGSSYKASNLLRNLLSQADFNNRLN